MGSTVIQYSLCKCSVIFLEHKSSSFSEILFFLFNLQEDAYYSVKEFPLCEYGKRCKRQNILHKLSHTFHHPASFIAEAIIKINKLNID